MISVEWIALACTIAFASLFAAAYLAQVTRQRNKLSVRPLLEIYRKELDNQPVEYAIHNCGHGPLIIKSFEVCVDNAPVGAQEANPILAALDKLGLSRKNVGGHLPTIGEALPVGGCISLLKFNNSPSDAELFQELVETLPRLKVRVRYASIYDEKFELFGNGCPKSAHTCDASAD